MTEQTHIRIDDVTDARVIRLLERHLANARALSPPDSIHALDIAGLRSAAISFWSMWEGDAVICCGALKALSPTEGEVKSMHTAAEVRGRGAAARMLRHIVATARERGYRRLSLETGSQTGFAPARALYAKHGFVPCGPFANYRDDPFSAFMTLELS